MQIRQVIALAGFLFLGGCVSNPLEQSPAPVTYIGGLSGAGSAGVHTVQSGDTVYSISERYRVDMPAIISVNKMSAPFRLNVGQRVRLPPPNKYKVRTGDTLYGISRQFGVTQTQIARLNNIYAPYVLVVGQELDLPSAARGPSTTTSSPVQLASAVSKAPAAPASVAKKTPSSSPSPSVKKASVTSSGKGYVDAKLPSSPGKFVSPVSGKIVSSYGPKKDGLHNDGINIASAKGSPVRSAADGQVVYAGNALKGYGNLVLVKHGGGFLTAYGHLGKIMVKKGAMLKQGQTLGTVGTSGQVSSPQVHFEIRKGTTALNPQKYI